MLKSKIKTKRAPCAASDMMPINRAGRRRRRRNSSMCTHDISVYIFI